MVFVRVCSGRFSRDITMHHARIGKEIRLSSCHNVFGCTEIAGEAYPGDIIGFVTRADFRVGDTISTDPDLVFEEIPRFAPSVSPFCTNSWHQAINRSAKAWTIFLPRTLCRFFICMNLRAACPF